PYYKKTMKWSYSKQNPYFYYRKICESGCEHAKYPWPLSAANSLFTTDYKRYGIDFFKKCKMDNYYACESVDGMTGRVKTGKAFATAAGFIAFAIKKGIN
ncbi:MAG TPA: metal-independent alpha-mannosidase, partial [Candidatus Goldiibacteriota bacterium]|nr:metal-independent alpha-mannosidase [Candidatus Goldiibacteriota bacterium]